MEGGCGTGRLAAVEAEEAGQQITVRMRGDDRAALLALAEAWGRSPTAVVKGALKQLAAVLAGEMKLVTKDEKVVQLW